MKLEDKQPTPMSTRSQIAGRLNVSYSTIAKLEKQKRLNPVRFTYGLIRFEEQEINRFLNDCRKSGKDKNKKTKE